MATWVDYRNVSLAIDNGRAILMLKLDQTPGGRWKIYDMRTLGEPLASLSDADRERAKQMAEEMFDRR